MPISARPFAFLRQARPAGGRRVLVGLCLTVLWASPGRAQTATGPSAPADAASLPSIESLVQRLDLLESEVRDLRAQLAAARLAVDPPAPSLASLPPGPAGTTLLPPSAEAHDHALGDDDRAPETAWRTPVTQIHWFSDVGYTISNRPGSTSSFALGQLDLFLTSKLSDRWSVLSEIVFRANTDNRFVVNPERLMVQYEPTEKVQIAMGRFHSAVGYDNAAYHHGSWFETAAARPSLFGAGFVPFHNVGVSGRARVPSGVAGLEVIGELGNGLTSGSRALEPTQNVIDENNHKATNLAVITHPTNLPGFQAGASWYRDRLTPVGLPGIDAQTSAAHVVYTGRGWELLNEVVAVRHADDGGAPVRMSYGWYSQSAYRFGSVRPYFRYQSVEGAPGDPVFGALGHRTGPVLGMRIDFSRFAALKFHVDRSHQATTDTTSYDGVVRLAFTF